MRLERIDGQALILGGIRQGDLNGLLDSGRLWWAENNREIETRIWYLPSLGKLGLEIPEAIRPALRALHQSLLAPRPSCDEAAMADLPGSIVPSSYQREGIGFLAASPGVVLADDVGLGKTIMSFFAAMHLRAKAKAAILIAATATSIWQWDREMGEMAGNAKPETFVARGSRKLRREAIAKWGKADRGALLVSHDSLRNDFEAIRRACIEAKHGESAPTFILDEAGCIRNPTTVIAARAGELRRVCGHLWALSATPIENGAGDLWSLLDWARPGWLGPFSAFQRRHLVQMMIPFRRGRYRGRFPKTLAQVNLGELRLAFRPLYLRRTAAEVKLELPEIAPPILRVLDLSQAQARIYNATVKAHRDGGRLPWFPRAKNVKNLPRPVILAFLLQVCNDPHTVGCKGESPKLQEIEALVEEWGRHEKIIIATQKRRFAYRILHRLERFRPAIIAGDTSARDRDDACLFFSRDSSCRVLVMTSAGERGLNLQAGSILIHADLPWNPAAMRQRLGRIYRRGQKAASIRQVLLTMRETVEERIMKKLLEKQAIFSKVIEQTQDILGDSMNDAVRDVMGQM